MNDINEFPKAGASAFGAAPPSGQTESQQPCKQT